MKSKKYSDNVIFFDGEFNGLSSKGTDFLSMAFIRPLREKSRACDGPGFKDQELYLELELPYNLDLWAKDNVLPMLTKEKVSKEEAVKWVKKFIGEDKPFLVADVNQFDWMGICGLFGVWGIPFNYIPIDFASILFARGIDPDVDRAKLAESYGVNTDAFQKHHAMSDARVLRELYYKI